MAEIKETKYINACHEISLLAQIKSPEIFGISAYLEQAYSSRQQLLHKNYHTWHISCRSVLFQF
jgi:hypothetical protein